MTKRQLTLIITLQLFAVLSVGAYLVYTNQTPTPNQPELAGLPDLPVAPPPLTDNNLTAGAAASITDEDQARIEDNADSFEGYTPEEQPILQ